MIWCNNMSKTQKTTSSTRSASTPETRARETSTRESDYYGPLDAARDVLKGTKREASPEEAQQRLNVCIECPHLISFLKLCDICGCHLPTKVTFADAHCSDTPRRWQPTPKADTPKADTP